MWQGNALGEVGLQGARVYELMFKQDGGLNETQGERHLRASRGGER